MEAHNRESAGMLNPSRAAVEAADEVKLIEQEMAGATVRFVLEAMPKNAWHLFVAQNHPRKDNDIDKNFDVNTEKLDSAIVDCIVRVESLDGEEIPFNPRGEWPTLADQMSDGQWTDFAIAVLTVNRGVKAAPFSVSASRLIRTSASESD